MATTPTNKPIPSEDPRDLKFNAGKIDEEVNGSADYYTDRFGVQCLTNTGRNHQFQDAQDERETDFVASQVDKEARFQQFLLSSGYQFLGDYEDGPLTFTARNQYTRYDGQYYRLNAATDVGFTTTGTDATSFANDVTHFVLMDADVLRQELAAADGAGANLVSWSAANETYAAPYIGKTLEVLFKTEQPIEEYYNTSKYGDDGSWDAAYLRAQWFVYKRGLSHHLRWPVANIFLTQPLLFAQALGDKFHEMYPSENFYNASTGTYKRVWDLVMSGTYCRSVDRATMANPRGTQLFLTTESIDDTTYKDRAIIYCGPTEMDQRRMTAAVRKRWPYTYNLNNFNIAGATADSSGLPWLHGFYAFNSGKGKISGMNVADVWGGGIIIDWAFEPIIDNSMVIGCGRMVNRDYYAQGLVDADYMLYAPFHTMFSPGSNVSDNTNFVRVTDCHFEDNIVAADAIIAGGSSPVWFSRKHYECATTASSSAANTKKTALAVGGFGVKYFGRDSESDFDDTAATVTVGSGQGNVIWEGGAMYSNTYEYLAQIAGYGTVSVNNNLFPNTSKVRVRTSGTGAALHGVNSRFSDIAFSGGNSNENPLDLTDCVTGAISMSYTHPARLVNVRSESITISNPYTSSSYPWILDGTTGYISSPTLHRVQGSLSLLSTSVASALRVALGKLTIPYYAYFATNFLSPLQGTEHKTVLTVSTTQASAALLQEGEYNYPSGTVGETAGLPVSGRSVLVVKNYTPDGYVIQTCKGISTGNFVQYYRVIPYSSGAYGTPTTWTPLTN